MAVMLQRGTGAAKRQCNCIDEPIS